MQELLKKTIEECRPTAEKGHVATYIPELEKGNPNDFGIAVCSDTEELVCEGDFTKRFTIQSVVKPILLLAALMDSGENAVRAKVGVEATGQPFDAINMNETTLIAEHFNPMVNIGAIVMCTLIRGRTYEERYARIIELIREIANDPDISVDENVYLSEKKTGNKNRALAFLLKCHGVITDDVEDVLDCYFKCCSILVNCRNLATIGGVFASHGRTADSEQLFPAQYMRFINAVLMTCGMYDGAGEFAVRVGVPAKSGVGGGIMAVVPNRLGIGIFSPSLDRKGNSIAGIQALEKLSSTLNLSIF